MKRVKRNSWFFLIVYILFLVVFISCHSVKPVYKEVHSALPSLNGDGKVLRTALNYEFMKEGKWDTLVDFINYSVPADAKFPENIFEGRLTIHGLLETGEFREIKDPFNYTDSADDLRKHLPPFDFEFIQSGSHIIPISRGYIVSEHPNWEYILEPGRVWNEQSDKGFSRATIPFTLKQKNQNCLHNGVMMFLFKNDGSVSSLTYQVVSETCGYYKFDMWGTAKITYQPYAINDRENYIDDYVSEYTNRIPVRPVSELTNKYPGANPVELSNPKQVSPEHLSVYGLLIDSIHYMGGCDTRYGTYPYCEVLNLPSYSTAKSIAGGIGLMRMEKLYPGTRKMIIGNVIPACNENNNWEDVTLENALDMTTGNFEIDDLIKDEGARHIGRFFSSLNHQGKIDYSCTYYTRKAEPGSKLIYHTSDTYILGTAMNAVLKLKTNNPRADYYRDLIVDDILKPLHTSPSFWNTQRTYDSTAQPFTGFGLFFHPDDVVKIGSFLNNGARVNNQEMLDRNMYSDVLLSNSKSGLPLKDSVSRYDNGFWLRRFKCTDTCTNNILIPILEGYGGIRIFLLPNQTVTYYFSDQYQYAGMESVIESNRIRKFCFH